MDEVDGFVLLYLPEGVGAAISGFAYEWEGVALRSRVWERELNGSFRLDLKVSVLRGANLGDRDAMRDFLVHYHEWDPQAWPWEEFEFPNGHGYAGRSVVFFLVEPGVAIEVYCPSGRFDDAELRRIAAGIAPSVGAKGR
jgi:hypothetical protein